MRRTGAGCCHGILAADHEQMGSLPHRPAGSPAGAKSGGYPQRHGKACPASRWRGYPDPFPGGHGAAAVGLHRGAAAAAKPHQPVQRPDGSLGRPGAAGNAAIRGQRPSCPAGKDLHRPDHRPGNAGAGAVGVAAAVRPPDFPAGADLSFRHDGRALPAPFHGRGLLPPSRNR